MVWHCSVCAGTVGICLKKKKKQPNRKCKRNHHRSESQTARGWKTHITKRESGAEVKNENFHQTCNTQKRELFSRARTLFKLKVNLFHMDESSLCIHSFLMNPLNFEMNFKFLHFSTKNREKMISYPRFSRVHSEKFHAERKQRIYIFTVILFRTKHSSHPHFGLCLAAAVCCGWEENGKFLFCCSFFYSTLCGWGTASRKGYELPTRAIDWEQKRMYAGRGKDGKFSKT